MIREITAVLVSWQDAADALEAAAALARARALVPPGGVAVSLVVVDNGGGLSPASVHERFPGAAVLVNAENRGYGPAANQGAAAAAGDVVLFLNPDARVEGEPFTPLARLFDEDPRVVAAAPRLVEMDGATPPLGRLVLAPPGREDQATFQLRALPTLAGDASELLLLDHWRPNHAGRRRRRYADEDRERGFAVEQAAAAALAVRRDAFVRIGGFDERYVPAWYEDVDLCARLLAEGAIVYAPEARVRHRGGESAARLGYAKFLPVLYGNALRYRALHYGPAARAAYRLLLAAGMTLRLLLLPFRRDVPRERTDAARAYVRVLGLAVGLSRGA
ncbi:MAG TPA: glycosyltransferase [Thermoanaerobaculia bacterium]|nr:glycosyltransferase [Thermoanaerobaculia bacterium]